MARRLCTLVSSSSLPSFLRGIQVRMTASFTGGWVFALVSIRTSHLWIYECDTFTENNYVDLQYTTQGQVFPQKYQAAKWHSCDNESWPQHHHQAYNFSHDCAHHEPVFGDYVSLILAFYSLVLADHLVQFWCIDSDIGYLGHHCTSMRCWAILWI